MSGSPSLRAGVLALGLGGYNVLLQRRVPRRWHLLTNLAAAAGLVGLARASGVDLGGGRTRDGLRVGSAAAVVIAGVVVGAAAVPPLGARFADERVRAGTRREIAYESLARIPVGTAVFEEVAFRGVLPGLLEQTRTPGRAAAVASVLFGLWHVVPPDDVDGLPEAAATVVVTTAAGFGFDWLRRRSGSLVAPIMAHAALNSTAYLTAQRALTR